LLTNLKEPRMASNKKNIELDLEKKVENSESNSNIIIGTSTDLANKGSAIQPLDKVVKDLEVYIEDKANTLLNKYNVKIAGISVYYHTVPASYGVDVPVELTNVKVAIRFK
jgi:hypothetical protein